MQLKYKYYMLKSKAGFIPTTQAFFSPLFRMHICFWWHKLRALAKDLHKHLSKRLMSKHYLKSDVAPWVETSSTSRGFHAHGTWFYWSNENALHARSIAERWIEPEWKCCSLSLSVEKMLSVRVWIQLNLLARLITSTLYLQVSCR